MIHPSTIIDILDMKDADFQTGRIKNIFQHYIEYAEFFEDKSAMIDFVRSGLDVKVKDWTGWTQLLSIIKIPSDGSWVRLVQEDSFHGISLSIDDLVPVYYPDNCIRGFHGERKFLYTLKEALSIGKDDYLRERNLTQPEDEEYKQFTHVYLMHFEDEVYESGYQVITKSGFFNGSDFHLFSGDQMFTDVRYK